jgi:RNA polymerase sigma-70 factor (ECF subfamily)
LYLYAFDDEYLRRLCADDGATKHHFVDYFNNAMLLKLSRRVRSFADLEDIRQEVFVRVLSKLCGAGGLREGAKLGAYVNAFCNNVHFEFYRKEGRTEPLPPGFDAAGDNLSPVDALVTTEARAQVQSALSNMEKRDADLLRAVFLDERDKDDICREYGVDREYLRVLLFRAREKFRSRYRPK